MLIVEEKMPVNTKYVFMILPFFKNLCKDQSVDAKLFLTQPHVTWG